MLITVFRRRTPFPTMHIPPKKVMETSRQLCWNQFLGLSACLGRGRGPIPVWALLPVRMQGNIPTLILFLLCLQPMDSHISYLPISRQSSYQPPKLSHCQTAILSCCTTSFSTYFQTARCFELNNCPGLNFVVNPCMLYPTVLLQLN